jgi:hypothetical protein
MELITAAFMCGCCCSFAIVVVVIVISVSRLASIFTSMLARYGRILP